MIASFLALVSVPFVKANAIYTDSKPKGIRLIFAFSAFILLASATPLQAQDEVSIPDANLLQVIRDRLGVPTGNITKGDMAGLTYLPADRQAIGDLTGLESAVNLRILSLFDNDIVDLGPLSGLTNLSTLGLSFNEIVDVGPLSGLTDLFSLTLYSNEIVDVGPLSGLTNLFSLHLEENDIVDVGPLSGLSNLVGLYLSTNNIVDVVPLSGLTNLSTLRLSANEIVDVIPLSGLTNLSELGLALNDIVDVGPLSGLTNLNELNLNGNEIVDLDPLSSLTNLEVLRLLGNADLDLTAGGSQRQIVDTFIAAGVDVRFDNPLLMPVSISDANLLKAIRDALGKHLGNITKGDMAELTSLTGNGRSIFNLAGLESAVNLSTLHLNGNEIVDLGPLSSLTNLEVLDLSNNADLDLAAGGSQRQIVDTFVAAGVDVTFDDPIFLSSYYAKLWDEAATVTVDVGGIGDWTVTEDIAWLAVNTASGSGSATVTLTVDANATQKLRVAEVEIGSETFTVRQHGAVDGLGLGFDAWLGAYYLDAEVAVMTPDAKNADPDMDGLSNEAEWKLGFDPTDFASRLGMSVTVDDDGTHVKVWPVGEGVAISLKSSVDLKTWIAVDESSESIVNGRYCFDTDSNVDSFYKIVVK